MVVVVAVVVEVVVVVVEVEEEMVEVLWRATCLACCQAWFAAGGALCSRLAHWLACLGPSCPWRAPLCNRRC